MTLQSSLQSRKQRQALLAQGGQVATNTSKGLRSSEGSEAAGNLLLDFDHAQIALGEIVVKIHAQIFQKAEDGWLVFVQAVEQISGGTMASIVPCCQVERWLWG